MIIALIVVTPPRPAQMLLALIGIGIVAAIRPSSRVAVAALGTAVMVDAPWIVAVLAVGACWFAVEHRQHWRRAARYELNRVSAKGVLAASLTGLLAGVIAAPLARAQVEASPLQLPVVAPPAVLVAVSILLLAAANAIGEELLWRGALLTETRRVGRSCGGALQAVSFGLAHWYGLPGGLLGCLLTGGASLLFLALHKRWGMLASIAAHFVADIMIFTRVIPAVLFTGWAA